MYNKNMYNNKSNCRKGPIHNYHYCIITLTLLVLLLVHGYCCNAAFIVSPLSSSTVIPIPLMKQTTKITTLSYMNDKKTSINTCSFTSMTLHSKTYKGDIDDDNVHDDVSVNHIDITIQKRINDNKSRRNIIMSSSTAVVSSLIVQSSFMMMKSQSSSAYAIDSSTTSTKSLKEEYRQGTAALNNDMDSMAPVPREAYIKLPSGVIYADVVKPNNNNNNNNNIVKVGSKVNIEWVLRRSNGYFVDSSQIHENRIPFVFTVGEQPNTAIVGLDEGIRGMQVGGVRRLLIPPSLAYVQGVNDGLPGPIPDGYGPRQQIRRIQNVRKDVPGEYIYLEIQLTRLR